MRRVEEGGSRILRANLATGQIDTWFEGEGEASFYGNIMGKQQLLPNGNLMVTASKEARAFEVSPQGEILWQIKNLVENGHGGLLTSVDVLAPEMDEAFFSKARAVCGG